VIVWLLLLLLLLLLLRGVARLCSVASTVEKAQQKTGSVSRKIETKEALLLLQPDFAGGLPWVLLSFWSFLELHSPFSCCVMVFLVSHVQKQWFSEAKPLYGSWNVVDWSSWWLAKFVCTNRKRSPWSNLNERAIQLLKKFNVGLTEDGRRSEEATLQSELTSEPNFELKLGGRLPRWVYQVVGCLDPLQTPWLPWKVP